MTHRKRRTGMLGPKSRRLNLECLEPRLYLSTYATVDLVPLPAHDNEPAHDYSVALGINDTGLVVGRSHSPGSSEKAAVVWSVDPLGGASVFPLPGVDGDPYAGVHGVEVNNQGMIAGESYMPEDASGNRYVHAVVWAGSPGAYVAHDLGTLGDDFIWSDASSVSEPDANGNVWVVGMSSTGSDVETPMRRAILWQVDAAGTVRSMTDLEPSESEVWANEVKVIGNSVFVAGDFHRDPPSVQACIWEADLNGNVVGRTDLGTDEFDAVTAFALNHDGDVVGYGYNSDLERHGYLDEFPYEGPDGSITDLGSLGNQGSRAEGINDNDVVVGRYYDVTPPNSSQVGQSYAFVWENGAMHKLLDQVSDKTFWLLFGAFDVNNHGEIVGNGRAGKRNDSEEHGFLARPEDAGDQHPPVANDDRYSTQADTTLTVAAPGVLGNDTDADGDPMTAALDAGPSSGTLALNADGSFTYTPSSGFTGADNFTYTVSDVSGGTDTGNVSIDVSAGNNDVALYVYDIGFESKAGGKFWRAVFEIRSDSNGDGQGTSADAVAPGVAITVEFAGQIYTGTTDADGVFRSSWIKDLGSGNHHAEVTDLVLANYFWDPMTLDLEGDVDFDGWPDDVLVL